MPLYILDLICALGLLGIAANLTVYLYLRHIERQNCRILERSTPEFPDLTPLFIETHQRIAIEAEQTRKEAVSYAKGTQTAMKLLTEWAQKHGITGEQVSENITRAIKEDGKKTRERITQVKTRLADEEREDQVAKRLDRESEPPIPVIVPEGAMILRDASPKKASKSKKQKASKKGAR